MISSLKNPIPYLVARESALKKYPQRHVSKINFYSRVIRQNREAALPLVMTSPKLVGKSSSDYFSFYL